MATPPKNISFSVRLDSQLKADAEELFSELGVSLGSAMNIFLKQSVRLRGFPFQLTLGADGGKESGAPQPPPRSGEEHSAE